MRFARIVFTVAGIWGLLVIVPLYFLEDLIGRQSPPAITHPEYFYGFAGVVLAWQLAFLVIARDPVRNRLLILPAIVEKVSFVLAGLLLFVRHRISASQALPAAPDLVLAILFVAAFLRTGPAARPGAESNRRARAPQTSRSSG